MLFVAGRRLEAIEHVERGLATAPADPALRARALHACARVLWRTTRQAAHPLALLDEAEPLAVAAGDLHIQGSPLGMRAFVANHHQRHEEAEALHTRALALWARVGNQHAVNSGRYNLAVCAQQTGRHAETLARLDELEARAGPGLVPAATSAAGAAATATGRASTSRSRGTPASSAAMATPPP